MGFSFKDFKRTFIPREISDVTEEVENFVRPVTDPIRSGIAKIVPKELKPYASTLATMFVPVPGGPLAAFLGGTATDAFFQKLMTDPDDEDTDVDFLKAALSGAGKAISATELKPKVVNPTDANVTYNPATNQFEAVSGLSTDPNQTFLQRTLGTEGTLPSDFSAAQEAATGFNTGDLDFSTRYFGGQSGAPGITTSEALRNLDTSLLSTAQDAMSFDLGTGSLKDVAAGVGKGLTAVQAINTPSQVRDAAKALEAAEREYQNYLDTLEADQRASIEADMNERIAAYKQYMGLAGYTNAEIDDALMKAGYIESGETAYAAQGGRIGFANGTDSMGIGNYIEAENVRTEFMDKIQRMLQAEEMNMRLNDPGLMRFGNALMPGGEGFYTKQEMAFPSMKERYEANIEKMKMDQAKDDYERDQIKKQLRRDEFDDIVNMIDDKFSENREQRKMASVGGRMTPQGDPISPDVPPGMQMDLRPGGFIPLGTKPKADDVPAMVGKNEFVLNDEAVSGIGKLLTGKPDPRAGARALYDLQNKMEAIV